MPETKPPVSHTKTAEQFAAKWIADHTLPLKCINCGQRQPMGAICTSALWCKGVPYQSCVYNITIGGPDTRVSDLAAALEAYAESELAALREQLAQANFRIEHLDGIAALRLTNWNLAEKKASTVAEKLAASERIAEGLATLVRRFLSSHRFMLNPCKKDPCDMCLGAKSVLARYQAQKGKP